MSVDLLEERLQSRLSQEGGVMIDPLTIITILAALIPLLINCFSASPRLLRRRVLNRPRLIAALHREGGWTLLECRKYAEAICDLADGATDEELQTLIEECKS